MKNKFYMQEFQFFDGESIIRFNIVDLNEDKQEIYVAITRQGEISVVRSQLFCCSPEIAKIHIYFS